MKLLELLMRGGSFGHYWLKQSVTTLWWNTDSIPDVPKTNEDIYFGVHPSSVMKGSTEGTKLDDICSINCLYAEFDAVNFDESKSLIAAHIKELRPVPTYIIDSGGGYHCYWILEEPFTLDTPLKREIARELQRNWVYFVGGSLEVHDLARILRIPGTTNYKYDPPRPVKIAYENLDNLYKLNELQELIPEVNDHRAATKIPETARPNNLSEQEIVDLAVAANDGQKFLRLFKGVDTGYPSASEADLAFCQILAFWTGGDYHKIDRIFRASSRMRPKWEREDYRNDTLTRAILNTQDYYIDPNGLLTAGAHDEGNASCTYAAYRDKIAYTEAKGWLHYRDNHWESELAEVYVEDAIVKTLKERRSAAVEAEEEDIVKAAKPTATHVRNAMTLLKRKVATPIAEFDTSLDELNCPNGVLNLRTGELLPHHSSRKFTYCIPTRYNPEASAKFWIDWLLEATGDQPEVVNYLQTAIGYSLTGHVREEVMFYVHGPARAGKGVFTETLIAMLGGRPLATEVDIDMFMSNSYGSSVGFSLAALKAARFVAASESRENEWLNAKRVKRWTGRNYITCAHKYGKDFTYMPQFKIWLTSNFPPQMDADDAAAWGRVRIIRFPESHQGKEDKLLKGKMTSSEVMEGILAWAVQGAMRWYTLGSRGLAVPKDIAEATEEARAGVDWVSTWIEEAVKITHKDQDRVPTDVYYREYSDWCKDNGVAPKSLRSLNRSLREAGHSIGVVTRIGGRSKRCWVGVSINGYSDGLLSMKGKPLEGEDEY